MSAALTDTQFEVFTRLTRRPFLVLDTEYTSAPRKDGGGDRIISYALVRIDAGRRQTSTPLYRVMNPGVPITAASTKVHGFTDADVAGKRGFAHHVQALLTALDMPDAILVQHTGVDLRVLQGELDRCPGRSGADLPQLPVLDTSLLPRLLRYPGLQARGTVGLDSLCNLTDVQNTKPHHAVGDARATADVLLALLRHAARTGAYLDIDELLAEHDQGTTHEPKGAGYIRSSRPTSPAIPAQHLARHDIGLPGGATQPQIDAWVALAQECAQLRCPWLRDEAVAAAPQHAATLRDPLTALLPSLTGAGQSATLVGAIHELIDPANTAQPSGLPPARALTWHAAVRTALDALPGCGPDGYCPDCLRGQPCPRDMLYQPVARIATLGVKGKLDRDRIKDHLFGDNPNRYINAWTKTQPKMAGYMAWLVVEHQRKWAKGSAGGRRLQEAMERGLHLYEPRLALLACEALLTTDGAEAAVQAAAQALVSRTTDDAYQRLADWLTWAQQSQALLARRSMPHREPAKRRGRPTALVPPNPYLPT